MPGRAAGRGRGRGLPVDHGPPPDLTEEQLSRLMGAQTISADQFNDASPPPSSTQTTPPQHTPSPTKPLNPHSNSFVPKHVAVVGSGLNVEAKEFVPQGLNVPLSIAQSGPHPYTLHPQEDNGIVSVDDVLLWDGRKTNENTPLLRSAATMLEDATSYPGVFDECAQELAGLVHDRQFVHDELPDLADLLLLWGIRDPAMRYTAVRIADLLCKTEIKDVFRPLLFKGLQKQYLDQKQYITERDTDQWTDEERGQFKELSLFFAEMFYRVRVEKGLLKEPITVLGDAVFELLLLLLNWNTEDTLMCACNILKLTGYLLEHLQSRLTYNKMENIITLLRAKCGRAMSDRCSNIIIAVVQSRVNNWGMETTPTKQHQQHQEHQEQASVEVPVSIIRDWHNYVDETGNVIEGDEDDDLFVLGDQEDSEADDEMIREYESFVQAFEDHLLLQEFGPTLSNQQQPLL